jgi:hypothetical protein
MYAAQAVAGAAAPRVARRAHGSGWHPQCRPPRASTGGNKDEQSSQREARHHSAKAAGHNQREAPLFQALKHNLARMQHLGAAAAAAGPMLDVALQHAWALWWRQCNHADSHMLHSPISAQQHLPPRAMCPLVP